MDKFSQMTQRHFILIMFFFSCCSVGAIAQAGCDYEVSLQNITFGVEEGYSPMGMITLEFQICNESNSDLPVQTGTGFPTFNAAFEVTIDATSSNLEEVTPVEDVESGDNDWFDWSVAAAGTNIYLGVQRIPIPAGACKTYSVTYDVVANTNDGSGPLGTGQNCVNVNLQPSTLISGTECHDESDDAVQICNHVNAALPLELLAFSAVIEDEAVHLHWITALEKNVSHFEVEKSSDGLEFEKLLSTPAIGQDDLTEYQSIDSEPFLGSSFYRLKMLDLDGSFEYSPIREVRNANQPTLRVRAFPNPATDFIRVQSSEPLSGKMVLYDATGRLVQQIEGGEQFNKDLNISSLAPGMYHLAVNFAKDQRYLKFVVSN